MSEHNPLAEWAKDRANRLIALDTEKEKTEEPKIETEGVFDPDLEKPDPKFLEEMEGFLDDPTRPLMKMFGSIDL